MAPKSRKRKRAAVAVVQPKVEPVLSRPFWTNGALLILTGRKFPGVIAAVIVEYATERVWLIGGFDNWSTVYRLGINVLLQPVLNIMPPLLKSRYDGYAFLDQLEQLTVIGGRWGNNDPAGTIEQYDQAKECWIDVTHQHSLALRQLLNEDQYPVFAYHRPQNALYIFPSRPSDAQCYSQCRMYNVETKTAEWFTYSSPHNKDTLYRRGAVSVCTHDTVWLMTGDNSRLHDCLLPLSTDTCTWGDPIDCPSPLVATNGTVGNARRCQYRYLHALDNRYIIVAKPYVDVYDTVERTWIMSVKTPLFNDRYYGGSFLWNRQLLTINEGLVLDPLGPMRLESLWNLDSDCLKPHSLDLVLPCSNSTPVCSELVRHAPSFITFLTV